MKGRWWAHISQLVDLDEPLVEEMHKDLVVDKANNIHNNKYFKTTY